MKNLLSLCKTQCDGSSGYACGGGGTPSLALVSKEVSRLVRSLPENFSFAKQTEKVFLPFTSHLSLKRAFTLAEVLITLGIIGVVAALTIPSLIEKHQKSVTLNKLKSTYSTLNNAIERAKVDYGLDINQWELQGSNPAEMSDYFAEHYIMPYLKIIKDCKNAGDLTGRKCGISDNSDNSRNFILSNGAIVSLSAFRDAKLSDDNYRVQVYMYINGNKKLSRSRDAFLVELGGNFGGGDKNRFWPYGYERTLPRTAYTTGTTGCYKGGLKSECFALIMHDGWQISPDYPW